MNNYELEPEDILSINLPNKLFTGEDYDSVKAEYRKLSSLWHPDKHINDGKEKIVEEVFKHIKDLYEQAIEKISNGSWSANDTVIFNTIDGKKFKFKYLTQFNFELGEAYIANKFILYSIDKQYSDLFENGMKIINSLSFLNKKMEEQISKHLPKINITFSTADRHVLVLNKTEDVLSLKDILEHYNNKIDPKHVAWIISGLYNIACYLEISKLNHNSLSIDTIFVSPQYHSVLLLGGWWYSVKEQENLIALSSKNLSLCPIDILNNKKSDFMLDLESIKDIGREMLGDCTGIKLRNNKDIPKQLATWLSLPSSGSAIKDYSIWQNKVLMDSFGVRRFTKMDLTSSDIYL